MNVKDLDKNFIVKKDNFLSYISNIKESMSIDIFSISNVTIVNNPYASNFPKEFFIGDYKGDNNFFLFIKSSLKFYFKQMYLFFSYLISFFIYKLFYKKNTNIQNTIFIDIFFLVDNFIKDKEFNENYFGKLYKVLDKYNQKYIFLPRLYGVGKNPFRLIKFFKIINRDKRDFLFEFELLSLKDFIDIFIMIVIYPFKTLRLKQKENTTIDKLFNNELIRDINKQQFEAFSRYIYGKNIAKLKVEKIYSWSEFQVVERSFNYGVRVNNTDIKLYGCQFYLNYKTYFNTFIYDIDFLQQSSFHTILVNGKWYILDREYIDYRVGVSLRYKEIFKYNISLNGSKILLLGSYIEKDTKYMLESVSSLDDVLFKNHPAVNIDKFGKLETNIKVVDNNIYELFEDTAIVISTASGTAVEAAACGISVIIIASQDNLTANPLIEKGKGKIWDIAFTKDDVEKLYNKLLKYREENSKEIKEVALWYRDNFFVEPNEENIVKAFELEKRNNKI